MINSKLNAKSNEKLNNRNDQMSERKIKTKEFNKNHLFSPKSPICLSSTYWLAQIVGIHSLVPRNINWSIQLATNAQRFSRIKYFFASMRFVGVLYLSFVLSIFGGGACVWSTAFRLHWSNGNNMTVRIRHRECKHWRWLYTRAPFFSRYGLI